MAKASVKKRGLPQNRTLKRSLHYVEELANKTGATLGLRISLDRVRPNPLQPRKRFDDLDELARSISQRGVLEPVLVRPEGRDYVLVAGERRYRAAGIAGLKQIPAIVLEDATDADALEIALVENLQRKDLTPFEEADALRQLQTRYHYTHEAIGQKLGRARSSVTETLRLAEMPDQARRACDKAGIHQRSLLLEILKQRDLDSMLALIASHKRGGVRRDEMRARRQPKARGRPRNFVFRHVLPNKATLELRFTKASVDEREVIAALRQILRALTKTAR